MYTEGYEKMPYLCPFCAYKFSTSKQMERHAEKYHLNKG